jgi:hypothetical protein
VQCKWESVGAKGLGVVGLLNIVCLLNCACLSLLGLRPSGNMAQLSSAQAGVHLQQQQAWAVVCSAGDCSAGMCLCS